MHHNIPESKDGYARCYQPLAWQTACDYRCVASEEELWCANAFYVYDSQNVAFYLLSDDNTRHGQMTGQRAKVAGTVNGQPKTVARIRGVQFKGEIRRLSGDEEAVMRARYVNRFPIAGCCGRRSGKSVRMSSSSPITRWGSAPSYTGYVIPIASESP